MCQGLVDEYVESLFECGKNVPLVKPIGRCDDDRIDVLGKEVFRFRVRLYLELFFKPCPGLLAGIGPDDFVISRKYRFSELFSHEPQTDDADPESILLHFHVIANGTT